MRVAITTLGCKVNQYESDAISEGFRAIGAEIVPYASKADIYVVNTCAVTAKAAAQSRQTLRRARRNGGGNTVIVATGCLVQTTPQEVLETMDWDVCLVGNDQKDRLPELIGTGNGCLEFYVGDVARLAEIQRFRLTKPLERTRAFLKVQDGCNAFCSYCIVPYARGRSRSLPLPQAIDQVRTFAENGIREVVVTGIHVGMYGADLAGSPDLAGLLAALCKNFPDVRFRLSSIEPTELTPELLSLAASAPNFCKHFHIPLQSGSDRILLSMNRTYTAGAYGELVHRVHGILPDAAIGADVLTGFPGEDRAAFEETRRLVESLPLSYVHAFPFSKRPHTLAAARGETVTAPEKAERVRAIREIGERKRKAFYLSQIGKVLECLVERKEPGPGLVRGTTSNYLSVLVKLPGKTGTWPSQNTMVAVKIKDVRDGVPTGVPV